jgi:hypothetical protein
MADEDQRTRIRSFGARLRSVQNRAQTILVRKDREVHGIQGSAVTGKLGEDKWIESDLPTIFVDECNLIYVQLAGLFRMEW